MVRIECEQLSKEGKDRLIKLLDSAAIETNTEYGRVWPLYTLTRDAYGTVYVGLERDGVMFYCHTL